MIIHHPQLRNGTILHLVGATPDDDEEARFSSALAQACGLVMPLALEWVSVGGRVIPRVWCPSALAGETFAGILAACGVQATLLPTGVPDGLHLIERVLEYRVARDSAYPFVASGARGTGRAAEPLRLLLRVLASLAETDMAVVQLVLYPVSAAPLQGRAQGIISAMEAGAPGLIDLLLEGMNGHAPPPDLPDEQRRHLARDMGQKAWSRGVFSGTLRLGLRLPSPALRRIVPLLQAALGRLFEGGNNLFVPDLTISAASVRAAFERRLLGSGASELSVEEAARFFHLPAEMEYLMGSTSRVVPKLVPQSVPTTGFRLGTGIGPRGQRPVALDWATRSRHLYVVGATGAGKTTLLKHLILADVQQGRGALVIDPKGGLVDELLVHIPRSREGDIVLIDLADPNWIVGLNPLGTREGASQVMCEELIDLLHRLFPDSWGPRMDRVLRFALLALMEVPGSTLLDLEPFLLSSRFRTVLLQRVRDQRLRAFWFQEFGLLSSGQRLQIVEPVLNKVGPLLSIRPLRLMLGQERGLRLREAMDSGKIVLANIPEGLIGATASALVGSLLVVMTQQAALSRADLPETDRLPFGLYVDEAQNFVTAGFVKLLDTARAFGLSVCLANQVLRDFPDDLQRALLGNVGSLVAFRLGEFDLPLIASRFAPAFAPRELVNLETFHAAVKTIASGQPQPAFSLFTEPLGEGDADVAPRVRRAASRYALAVADAERVVETRWRDVSARDGSVELD